MRSVTYAAIADDDAIKTSVATAATLATYITTALNGAIGQAAMNPPRNITAKTSSSAGSYNLVAIVITGTDSQGRAQTEVLTLTAVNGNETIVGTKAFKTVTSIAVPANVDTSGAIVFGVRDIFCPKRTTRIRAVGAGNVKVGYHDGTTDIVPFAAGESQDIAAARVYGDSSTTSTNLTVFFD